MGLRRFRQTPIAVFLKYEHFCGHAREDTEKRRGVRPLFSFREFSHDPQRVVRQFALVGSEHLRDFRISVIPRGLSGFELSVASFASSDETCVCGEIVGSTRADQVPLGVGILPARDTDDSVSDVAVADFRSQDSVSDASIRVVRSVVAAGLLV
jgi:hypothetical protein